MWGGGTFGRTGGAVPRTGGAYVAGDVTITGIAQASRLWATSLGSAAVPAVAIGDGDSGLYEAADDFPVVSAGGAFIMSWTTTQVDAYRQVQIIAGSDLLMGAGGQIFADPGTAALPGYAFVGDPDTGMFRQGANTGGMSAGSVNTFAFDGTNYFQVPSYFNGNARFFDLMAVPAPLANYFALYAIDTAGKVEALIKMGATGNTVTLGTEF